MGRATISAVIITKDEEKNIKRCLESLKWVDEIVIVDGESSDSTVNIARTYNAKIVSHKFEGDFGLERNIGNKNASGDWILALDADEEIPKATREKIENMLRNGSEFSAFNVLRHQYFLDNFMKYGGKQHRIVNFFRRGKAYFDGKVHHLVKVDGKIGEADFAINHYPFNSITQFIQKHERYTTYEAREMFEKYGSAKLREVPFNVKWKPVKIFYKTYFKKKGYKDGLHGFIFCVLFSWSYFLRWVKYWELCKSNDPVPRRVQGKSRTP